METMEDVELIMGNNGLKLFQKICLLCVKTHLVEVGNSQRGIWKSGGKNKSRKQPPARPHKANKRGYITCTPPAFIEIVTKKPLIVTE